MGASVVAILDAPKLRVPEPEALPNLRFVTIPPVDVGMWFDLVERAIDDIHTALVKKDGTGRQVQTTWGPEEMRAALEQPRAFLCVTFHDKRPVGVTVLCRDGDQFAEEFDWLIWIAWADPENTKRGIARHVREFTRDSLKAAAKKAGARRLKMYSARPGWERAAKELGFELAYRAYTLEIA